MTKRIALLSTLTLSLVLLPGCPGVSALVGTWEFMISSVLYSATINADGTATAFRHPTSNAMLGGTLTWEANGTEFIMRLSTPTIQVIHVGRVANDSSINGGWVRWEAPDVGTGGEWTAVKQ